MKITVINGTEKHGITYRLKEIFLERFRGTAQITEFYLPKDCPAFCMGCTSCIFKGENTCKDAGYVQKIAASLSAADLIVMTSPAYVMHITGAMKALLDHFAYRWMPHRPAPEMFAKRAVVITQCLGAGAADAAKDIKHSLSWWGISEIQVFAGKLMDSCIAWEKLSEKRRRHFTKKITRLAEKVALEHPPRVSAAVKAKFLMCRLLQKSLYQNDPEYRDAKYWAEQGWLGKERPWKTGRGGNMQRG